MKKLLLLIAILGSTPHFSQGIEDKLIDKRNIWEQFTNPSTSNFITKHFEKSIDSKLLQRSELSSRSKTISLFFNLDADNSITNIRTRAKDRKLEKALINSFLTIPFDSLAIEEKSSMIDYSLQIITLENGKPVLKCSSKVLHQYHPVFKGCENETNFLTLNKCNNTALATNIIANFDISLGPRVNLSGIVDLYAIFIIDKETGKFRDIRVKAPDESLEFELKRILYQFPACYSVGRINGKPSNISYSLPVKYPIRTKKNEQ